MLTCVIFLVSCCIVVSCMFLFYPAKNQNDLKRAKELTNLKDDSKPERIRSNSIKYCYKDVCSKSCRDQRRSQSINVDTFNPRFHVSSNDIRHAFSFRAVIEPLPNRCSKEMVPEATSVAKENEFM